MVIGIAKYAKLNVFKRRTGLHVFFSIFSNCWGYTDIVNENAYVAKPSNRLKIGYYSKFEEPDDIKIVGWGGYNNNPHVENIFVEIDIDKAHFSRTKYGDTYVVVELVRPVCVL